MYVFINYETMCCLFINYETMELFINYEMIH